MGQGNTYNDGAVSKRPGQRQLLEMIQRGDSFLYAILTNDGAVKIGVSRTLFTRRWDIGFGGTKHILAYMPGTFEDEQALHASISAESRIYRKLEYYYPTPEVRGVINDMRGWMGLKVLSHSALPRMFDCPNLHRAIQDREAADRHRAS